MNAETNTSETAVQRTEHQNPVTADDVTDEERAQMLREYLDAISDICPEPRLMPLDDEGKKPAFAGEGYPLGSEEAQSMLHAPDAAVEAVRNGARGFALYAGKENHGTEYLVLVDHDDMDAFPLGTLPDTLTVMSGSGRGYHETFENAGDVRNAQGTGGMDGAGEVRATNWYCVLPGSVHPSGGVYHITEHRLIAELEPDDIPEDLQPSTSSYSGDEAVEIRRDSDRDGSAFENNRGMSLDEIRTCDPELDGLLSEDYPSFAGTRDDSRIDAMLVWRLRYHHFEPAQITDIWQQYRWREKLKRDDYIERTIRNCASHDTRARYDRAPTDIDATLPSTPSFDDRTVGSDSRSALTLEHTRQRCQDRIEHAIQHGDRVLIDALPTTGKSRGLVAAVANTGVPATVFTARHDLYNQYVEWCQEEGLDYYTLPSFHNDCPTARGDYDDDDDAGDEWKDRVMSLYRDGARPKEIHKHAVDQFGQPLPCEEEEDGCPYKSKWDFDPEDYDLLIGHYTHAYNDTVTADRVVAFDESPTSSFVTRRDGDAVSQIVSTYLDLHDPRGGGQLTGLPFDDYTDLIEKRSDDDLREEAIDWFESNGVERDVTTVLSSSGNTSHALAPILTYGLLVGEDLGNGWEFAPVDDSDGGRVAAHSRESGEMVLLRPPDLDESEAIIGLDGTPVPRLWRLTVDPGLDHRQVLDDTERSTYLSEVLGLQIFQTTDAVKPYSSSSYVNTGQDRVLFEWVRATEDRKPALITTQKALDKYRDAGALVSVGDPKHYGDLKGSNEFAEERVGIVAGSRHFGDEYVQMWGALGGEAVERDEGKGTDLDYGSFGNEVLRHMREHETLQAVMRFGRDGDGANVYVHTATLPEWVPIAESMKVRQWSDGMREVIGVVCDDDRDEWTTRAVADDDRVSISPRQVRTHLNRLAEYGFLDRQEATAGSGYHYEAVRLSDLLPSGVVVSR